MKKLRIWLCLLAGHRSVRINEEKFMCKELKQYRYKAHFECERCGATFERVFK